MALRDIYSRREDLYDSEPRLRTRRGAGDGLPGLLTILWRQKLTILAVMLVALAAGIAYIIVTPPRYQASVSILIDPRLGKVVGTDPVQPGFIPDVGAMDSQIKLFTSQTVLSRVAKMANLSDDPEFNGSQRSLIQRILHPMPFLEGSVDLLALEQAITVKRPERTYVVGIDVLAKDPKKAAEIANDLVQAYIDDQVSSRVDAAQDDTRFVREKLDKLSGQIRDADDKIEIYKSSNNIVDSTGLRSNEQQVADLTRGLADARAKASEAKSRLSEIQRLSASGNLDSATQALNSLTIERLRQQQAETEQQVARLATTLGARHPQMLEAQGRAAKITRLIRDELQRLKIGADANYQAANRNATQISAEVDRLKGQSNDMSKKLVPLDQMERNVAVLRSSFERFSKVNDNLAQQEAGSPPGRVLSVARPPVSPSQPKKTLVGLISIAAGLFFGLAAAFFVEGSGPREPIVPSVVYEAPREPPVPKSRPTRPTRRYWDDDDQA